MPQPPGATPGHDARGDGDDAVVKAWGALFDAFLRLDGLGVRPDVVLLVLRGYHDDWPF
jgi:hypothetical protein